jgi:exopolysaccharide biosynthesis polyprenyl glycosylphosphotransferase
VPLHVVKAAASSRGRRWTTVRRALLATDAVALSAAAVAALVLADPDDRALRQIPWALACMPWLLLLFKLYGLYDRDDKRLGHATLDDVPAVFHALLAGTLGLWGFLKIAPPGQLVFIQVLAVLALTFVVALAARAIVRRLLPRVVAPERVLVVGTGVDAQLVLRKIRGHARFGLLPVGYLSDRRVGESSQLGLPYLGTVGNFAALCREHRIDRAVIASTAADGAVLADLIREANEQSIKISLLPSLLDVLGPSTVLDDLQGVTVLGINPARFTRSSWLIKRAMDVVVSAVTLLSLLPLLPIIALAIKLDSPGPVFFAQERVGRGARRFRVYKLRTMLQDAEARTEELRARSAHAAWLLLDRDPRVTRFGRFLRRTSIDEIPQVWNVLRGDMSLVGPRPMPLDTDGHISGWGRRRLDLTPGITGPWQVLGRTSIPFEEMVKLDYLYVTNWSLWGDIELLLRTVLVVLSRRGVN